MRYYKTQQRPHPIVPASIACAEARLTNNNSNYKNLEPYEQSSVNGFNILSYKISNQLLTKQLLTHQIFLVVCSYATK